jgi:hypothetical protein
MSPLFLPIEFVEEIGVIDAKFAKFWKFVGVG